MSELKFTDFIAQKLGHRNWYTRPRPAPVKARGRVYIKPSEFRTLEAEYDRLMKEKGK